MKYRTRWWAAAAATLGLATAACAGPPPGRQGAHGERHATAQPGCMGEHKGEQHAMRGEMRGHDGMPGHRQGGMHGHRQGAAENSAPQANPPTQ